MFVYTMNKSEIDNKKYSQLITDAFCLWEKTLILLPQPISMCDKNSVYCISWLQLKHILPMQFWDRLQLEQCHFGFSENRRSKRDDGVKQGLKSHGWPELIWFRASRDRSKALRYTFGPYHLIS
jgi:hypothetical protein